MNLSLAGLPRALALLVLLITTYALLAAGLVRYRGPKAVLWFWVVTAPLWTWLVIRRAAGGAAPSAPSQLWWQASIAAFLLLGTAGACLRIVQLSRRAPLPSLIRHTLGGVLGYIVVGGAVFLGILVVDMVRFFH